MNEQVLQSLLAGFQWEASQHMRGIGPRPTLRNTDRRLIANLPALGEQLAETDRDLKDFANSRNPALASETARSSSQLSVASKPTQPARHHFLDTPEPPRMYEAATLDMFHQRAPVNRPSEDEHTRALKGIQNDGLALPFASSSVSRIPGKVLYSSYYGLPGFFDVGMCYDHHWTILGCHTQDCDYNHAIPSRYWCWYLIKHGLCQQKFIEWILQCNERHPATSEQKQDVDVFTPMTDRHGRLVYGHAPTDQGYDGKFRHPANMKLAMSPKGSKVEVNKKGIPNVPNGSLESRINRESAHTQKDGSRRPSGRSRNERSRSPGSDRLGPSAFRDRRDTRRF